MKRNKKILALIAGLALSGTLLAGAGVLTACNSGESSGGNSGGNNNGEGPAQSSGKVVYIAADGKFANEGTKSSPKNVAYLNDKTIEPGTTIYLIPGHYNWTIEGEDTWWRHGYNGQGIVMTASGTPDANIKIVNAALDPASGYTGTDTTVTLDFGGMEFNSSNRGVQIYGDYIYWYGIDICGAGDNGLYIGGSYNTVEYSEFYNNRDSGLQLGRAFSEYNSINQWPSYNIIKNCTSHNNYDDETYGENADGFAAKLTIGYGNVFDGCIAYRNSDDGWDLYAKSDSGNIGCVIIYNCVAFENGYLEYTQAENHENVNYKSQFDEPNTNSFKTRDGDGNGFKLGGSVMEGDVKMYNCLSFQNRMHGVTDNSNPGYIKVEGVTSYDNSAAIDDNATSPTFGQVISTENHDKHGNIDVARQDYSYNTVKNVLSVKSSIAKSLDNDAYRGSVINSLLNAGAKTNVVKGSIDADTHSTVTNTSQVNALVAEDLFEKLPVVKDGDNYTYNISGHKDLDNAASARVHNKYRNSADHSINMGDILAKKSDYDYAALLGEGVSVGSTLNKTSWAEYTHFTDDDLLAGVSTEVMARLLKAKETLTINADEDAVYQDFEVPSQMTSATIDWTTDSEYLKVGKKTELSGSESQYITIGVTRPTDEDKTAKLTAKISYLNHSITKDFNITIKKDQPSIGQLSVKVAETAEVYLDSGKIIMDLNKQYKEPVLEVENGAYYNGRLLTPEQYILVSTYEYAPSAADQFTAINGFYVNHAGVYRITHKVTLVSDTQETATMSYMIFVASTSAKVDFDSAGAQVSVYKDGYTIAGVLTNVTGTLYTVASETEIAGITAQNIKDQTNVEHNDFRATAISFNYTNANSKGYHIYYALANVDGEITSELGHVEIGVQEISSEADFMKVAGGAQLNGEEVAHTIYMLTKDLDFTETAWSAGSNAFLGLLNGNDKTVSNVTVSGAKNASLFKKVQGGTIMNIKFNNIKITATGDEAGIVSTVYGGYFHNIAITNLLVTSSGQRTGGLIAHVYEGATPTAVSQVSIINPKLKLTETGAIDETATENENKLYYIKGSGNRAAGIIGFIQTTNPITNNCTITVKDCYVDSYISCGGYSVSSIVGEFNENGQMAIATREGYDFSLSIDHCVSAGVLVDTGTGRMGGMLGYHNGGGVLRISNCVSLQTMYYKDALLEVAQKNQSGTVGNFSTAATAKVNVSNCMALMEEYNTDYGVTSYTLSELTNKLMFAMVNFDTTTQHNGKTVWEYVYDEEDATNNTLKAPYLQLNYIDSVVAEG